MADWIEPIFDRTPADVTRAKLKVKEWIEALARGESVEISDLKGYINAIDLNRIENDTEYLSMASELKLSIKTDWKRTDLPNVSEIDRIIKNIQDLITDFEFGEFTYEMPTTILTYSHANTVEHNLSLIKYLLEDMSTRIQAEFTHIDAYAKIEVFVALTLPFDLVYQRFLASIKSKVANADSIPINLPFDTMTVLMSTKAINSLAVPTEMDLQIEFGLNSEAYNDSSNPIFAEMPTIFQINGELHNSDSDPMVIEFCPTNTELAGMSVVLSPVAIKAMSNIVTDFTAELLARVLLTNEVTLNTDVLAGIQTTKFSFADMFAKAIYSIISTEVNTEIIRVISNPVTGTISSTIQTEILLGLYAYSKLSDYKSISLTDMDKTTLKDLSYREL